MPGNRCELAFTNALRGKTRGQVRDLLASTPEQCPHDDCGEPRNCRQRCANVVAMQIELKRMRAEIPMPVKS